MPIVDYKTEGGIKTTSDIYRDSCNTLTETKTTESSAEDNHVLPFRSSGISEERDQIYERVTLLLTHPVFSLSILKIVFPLSYSKLAELAESKELHGVHRIQ